MSELEGDFVFLFSINIYGDSFRLFLRPSNLLCNCFCTFWGLQCTYLGMYKAISDNLENKIYKFSVINVHHVIITLCDLEIECIEIYNVVFNIQKIVWNIMHIKYSQYWCHHLDSRSRLDKNRIRAREEFLCLTRFILHLNIYSDWMSLGSIPWNSYVHIYIVCSSVRSRMLNFQLVQVENYPVLYMTTWGMVHKTITTSVNIIGVSVHDYLNFNVKSTNNERRAKYNQKLFIWFKIHRKNKHIKQI